MINPQSGTSKFEIDQLDPSLFFQIDKLKVGEISSAVLIQSQDGQQSYRLLTVTNRTQPHRVNLQNDYQRIQNNVLTEKQNKATTDWVKKKKNTTYIQINGDYKTDCLLLKDWVN